MGETIMRHTARDSALLNEFCRALEEERSAIDRLAAHRKYGVYDAEWRHLTHEMIEKGRRSSAVFAKMIQAFNANS